MADSTGHRSEPIDKVDDDPVFDDPVFDDQHAVLLNTGSYGQFRVGGEVAPLAVHRQHILRPHNVVVVDEFASTRMSGDMHGV